MRGERGGGGDRGGKVRTGVDTVFYTRYGGEGSNGPVDKREHQKENASEIATSTTPNRVSTTPTYHKNDRRIVRHSATNDDRHHRNRGPYPGRPEADECGDKLIGDEGGEAGVLHGLAHTEGGDDGEDDPHLDRSEVVVREGGGEGEWGDNGKTKVVRGGEATKGRQRGEGTGVSNSRKRMVSVSVAVSLSLSLSLSSRSPHGLVNAEALDRDKHGRREQRGIQQGDGVGGTQSDHAEQSQHRRHRAEIIHRRTCENGGAGERKCTHFKVRTRDIPFVVYT